MTKGTLAGMDSLGETADYHDVQRPGSASIPARIGNYTIKRALATGGMGTVYLAVQEHPRRDLLVIIHDLT